MSTGEIHQELDELLERIAENVGEDKGTVISMLDVGYGIDVYELDDETAESFAIAYKEADFETVKEILEDYDVTDDQLEELRKVMEADSDSGGNLENGDSPVGESEPGGAGAKSSKGLDPQERQEVEQIVSESVPTASDIANEITQSVQPQGGQQGDSNPQGQMAMQLAQMFLQQQSGGGGANAEIGQMFQKAAMKNYLKRLSRPSLGDMMEMKMYDQIADEKAKEWKKEMFEGDPLDELEQLDEDDDEDGGWFSW